MNCFSGERDYLPRVLECQLPRDEKRTPTIGFSDSESDIHVPSVIHVPLNYNKGQTLVYPTGHSLPRFACVSRSATAPTALCLIVLLLLLFLPTNTTYHSLTHLYMSS